MFIGWGYLVAVIQGPPPEQVISEQELAEKVPPSPGTAPQLLPGTTPGAKVTPTAPSSPETVTKSSEFPGEESTIQVSTKHVTFTITNKGAMIKSILLPQYQTDEGEPVELVQREEGVPLPLAIEASDAQVTRILQNAFYDFSVSSLSLSESQPTGQLKLTLNHDSGLSVVRELTFHHSKSLIDVQTRINAPGFAGKNLNYRVLFGPGLGGKVDSKTDHFAFSGPTTFVNNEREETPPEEITKDVFYRGDLVWTSFQNKYFAAALIPEQGIKSAVIKKSGEHTYVGLEMESVQSAASTSYILYAGTKGLIVLEEAGHKLVRLLDYGWLGNKFAFLVKPLLKALQYFYGLLNNYGWAIIVITFFIKILFFPLTHKSFKSMKGMQKVQPYVKVIQERHKKDRQKMNEEMLELYKKHKVNPLGGCLPMLLQVPVFIALYHALFFSIELRGAPFVGWVTDLSVADPYYVWPVMMGASMFLQQKLNPSIGDPTQQKIMMMLPVVFTFLFMTFPAGLVIYWTTNNILTIAQQYYIYKFTKD